MLEKKIAESRIIEGLNNAKKIAIIGHMDSDADCFGAMLALNESFKLQNKESYIISPEKLPSGLSFFKRYTIAPFKSDYIEDVDLVIVVDCPDANRTTVPKIFSKYKANKVKVALIDHHISGNLKDSDYALIEQKCCSASEIVYHLLRAMNATINKNIATFLLTGIYNDTSGFQTINTTGEALKVASNLISLGAPLNTIVTNSVSNHSISTLKAWGLILSRLYLNPKYNIAVTYLSNKDIVDNGLTPAVLTGVSNYINVIKDARGTVFMMEDPAGTIKISLRTRDPYINMANLAKNFGGGGHIRAAGFSFSGRIVETDKGAIIV